MPSDDILHLVLSFHWYDMIRSGKKRAEYREIKPFWTRRLFSRPYKFVLFRRGYTREYILFEIDGPIIVTNEKNDLNLPFVYKISFKPYLRL